MINEKTKIANENDLDSKNKSEYSKDESRGGHCPKCGDGELEYGSSENEGTYIEYPWECHKCGSAGVEFGEITFDGHRVDSSPFFEEHKEINLSTVYKKYAIKCLNCENDTFDFQWEENRAVYKCENCGEFYDDGQEHMTIDYNIIADDGTILAGLLSKFTIGDKLDFYENYDEETGEPDGVHGVKMINEFDSSVLFFNYYGGGTAYTIDVTRDNSEEERLEHIKDCLHGYFNIIGFHRIYVNTEN